MTSEPARVTSSGKPAEKPAPAVPVKKEVVRKGVKEESLQRNEAKKEPPEEIEAKKETETKKETQNGGSKKSAAAAPPKRDATIASMLASAGAAKVSKLKLIHLGTNHRGKQSECFFFQYVFCYCILVRKLN